MARLFIAVWPPAEVLDALSALVRSDQSGVRWMPRENWHVTLRFLGEAEPGQVSACLEHEVLPAATAVLGPGARRMGRALVVPVAGLDGLAAVIARATESVGQWVDGRPFQGHVTLGRVRPGTGATGRSAAISTRMDVTEVTLVHSELRGTGSVYHVVDRWPTG